MKRSCFSIVIKSGMTAGIIAALMLIAPGSSHAAGQPRVTLKDSAVINKDDVLLKDIATIAGDQQSGAASMATVAVATSPLPGKTRFLSLDYIRIRLRQAGFDPDAVSFGGARDVRISRDAAYLPKETVIRAVEAAIRNRMPWKQGDVTIDNIRINDDIRLPTGRLTHRIIPKEGEAFLGQTSLGLYLYVDGQLVVKTWAHAHISVMGSAVRVVRPLGKHQRIEPNDVAVVRTDLSDLSSDTVRQLAEVIGNRTTRMIYPNTYLKRGMFTPPPLVRRGDIVKIIATTGLMTITATGKVKQKGCKGDMVHVVNTDSNRVIIARVIGPGAVEVEF